MRREQRSVLIVLTVTLVVVLASLALILASAGHAFPEIDRSRLLITLERSGCLGDCPAYRVTIDGEGNVVFTTDRFPDMPTKADRGPYEPPGVVVAGTYRTRIDRDDVDRLVARFRAIGFFGLRDAYEAQTTDLASHVLLVDTGNGQKAVLDYGGVSVGMPPAVKALQDEVDRIARTAVWIKGLPAAVPQLVAERARFDGRLGMRMMQAAIARNDVATMDRLLALGAPIRDADLYSPLTDAAANTDTAALDWLLAKSTASAPGALFRAIAAAVYHDNSKAFDRLRAAGALDHLDIEQRTALLGSAAQKGDETLVAMLLTGDVHINGNPRKNRRPPDDPPLFVAAQGDFGDGGRPIEERRRVVRRLLDAGAKADWKDPVYPQSALFLVDDAPIAYMLIEAGADPNFRDDYEGEPIIFSVSNEGVALVMIAAGLDLKSVRPADRMSLRRWAEYQKWNHVLRLLDRRERPSEGHPVVENHVLSNI